MMTRRPKVQEYVEPFAVDVLLKVTLVGDNDWVKGRCKTCANSWINQNTLGQLLKAYTTCIRS